jgi:acyl-CoA synthetase (AMP-forming)/AMP-acid ligase II/acyl carrier protein
MQSTAVDLLHLRAATDPDKTAFTFLTDGDSAEEKVTYGELDERARRIAVGLRELAPAGARVVLLFPPGLRYIEAFLGALYAGIVPVPAYPPDPSRLERTLGRLQSIVVDCDAALILTEQSIVGMAAGLAMLAPEIGARRCIATDAIDADASVWSRPSTIRESSLAFLQYTSGSTGSAKGVMVSHGNILANDRIAASVYGNGGDEVIVSWLPLYHDMGLIGGVLNTIVNGATMVFMSPLHFLQKPARWVQAISRYRGTFSGGPNFAYDLCARKVTDAEKAELDLSRWRFAVNGAEPVRLDTLETFARTFAPCGFRRSALGPGYGLAEATLFVANSFEASFAVAHADRDALRSGCFTPATGEPGTPLIAYTPAPQLRVAIASPESGVELENDRIGEIWVGGPSVASGYWRREDTNEASFRARLPGHEGTFLRTGDLGFLHEGRLCVTGRLKDVLIVRGKNHAPQDIERTVEDAHPSIRLGCTAAFSVTIDGEERLVVAAEFERRVRDGDRRGFSVAPAARRSGLERRASDLPSESPGAPAPISVFPESVIDVVRAAVTEAHGVAPYAVLLLKPRSIPKTSSGKIQRHACREGFLASSLEVVEASFAAPSETSAPAIAAGSLEGADEGAIERALRTRLARLLGTREDALGDPPVAQLGIDSLDAIEIHDELEQALGATLAPAVLLRATSISALARELAAAPREAKGTREVSQPPRAPSDVTYRPAFAQAAFLRSCEIRGPGPTWNVPMSARLAGAVDLVALRRALQGLVRRHDSLRTIFPEPGVARVLAEAPVDITVAEMPGATFEAVAEAVADAASKVLPLERGPLIEARIDRVSEREHILSLVVHHAVFDGGSVPVLIRDLADQYALARGEKIAVEEAPSYRDWAEQQHAKWASPSSRAGLESFWRGYLDDAPAPSLRRTTGRQATIANRTPFRIAPEVIARLGAVARSCGATMFMALKTALELELADRGHGLDQLVSTPTVNRSLSARSTIGQFIESIVIRTRLPRAASFRDRLRAAVPTTLSAYDHAALPARFALATDAPFEDPRMQVRLNVLGANVATPGSVQRAAVDFQPLALDTYAFREFDLHLVLSPTAAGGWSGLARCALDVLGDAELDAFVAAWLTRLDGMSRAPDERIVVR